MEQSPRAVDNGLIGPLMMILVGCIFLIGQFVPGLGFSELWPLLMIGAGVAALYSRR